MLRKKSKDEFFPETNDLLIVFDEDKRTSDIKQISEFKDGEVLVIGHYNVPYEDCVITNSDEGRNFFYRAPTQSITETKRLAKLEQSIILSQITSYREPEDKSSIDMTKILLFGLVFFAFIILGISSCGN
ncbi:hypothetical protein [Litchfieldia salsa]|uniref:Uncharacterized protein n=1 Tax=Litchfieldia salsa TaxID=930152 RepID=A0A1H0VNL4_9BACI|nr:hypothetical protein [Litchfieldia salsa]SDP80030.1 hypothetical protein SAMN05216565_107103 [Litchfieldia salsa]